MIETNTFTEPISLLTHSLSDGRLELSRLLAAAAINQEFRHQLLDDPGLALDLGFQDEEFTFTSEERDLILSIRADSLPDLACQLARTFDEDSHPEIKQPAQPGTVYGY